VDTKELAFNLDTKEKWETLLTDVEIYLDKHLRKVLKKSVSELRRRTEDMDRLRAIQSYKISTPGL
jgi:hypothetical protein